MATMAHAFPWVANDVARATAAEVPAPGAVAPGVAAGDEHADVSVAQSDRRTEGGGQWAGGPVRGAGSGAGPAASLTTVRPSDSRLDGAHLAGQQRRERGRAG